MTTATSVHRRNAATSITKSASRDGLQLTLQQCRPNHWMRTPTSAGSLA